MLLNTTTTTTINNIYSFENRFPLIVKSDQGNEQTLIKVACPITCLDVYQDNIVYERSINIVTILFL